MANSLTEIYNPTGVDSSNLESFKNSSSSNILNSKKKNKNKKKRAKELNLVNLAPKFKYQVNFPIEDIEEVRRLLALERQKQDEEEFEFWTPDYERIKKDDWLVTRFLLRGFKASQRCSREDQEVVPSASLFVHTLELVKSCAKFRRDYRINPLTSFEEFPIDWIKVNGLFNYKSDLAGNPTIYLRISQHKPKLIETKESRHEFKRLLLLTLEKCDQDLFNNMGKGVCCIFDMSEATFENIDLELASWMIKSFKSCSPKLLAYVIVYNLPWFFSATFKLLTTTLMSDHNKQCLKFVYGNEILKYIEHDNLPDYIASKF